LRNEQRLGARVVARAAEQLATHFNPARIALAVTSALHGPELIALRDTLLRAHERTAGALRETSTEIRQLIRQMSMANPIWGAPRIHGELLMLGIEVSQATVGRYMPWRPKVPSPTWRSFLRNHMRNMAAVDMFVVANATFRLLYALIVLGHGRRRIIQSRSPKIQRKSGWHAK
jgi:hypothetical protein